MPQRRSPRAESSRGERHLDEPLKRKLPEKLYRAWSKHLGESSTDLEAATNASLWAASEGTAETESARGFISHLREEWLKTSLHALRKDPDFFRRLADLLEAEERQPREATALYCAVMEYVRLWEDLNVDPENITKQQVENLAKRRWAFWRLSKAEKIKGPFERNFGKEQEALLAKEVNLLPDTRWQDIWKRPEFAGLKDGKRGRKAKIVD
jgi:hypothetical protein